MQRHSDGSPGIALGVGAAVLMIVCCAGPALIAAGVLGIIGRVLDSPIIIAASVALAAVAIFGVLVRRRHGDRDDCCTPESTPTQGARDHRDPSR